MSRCEKLLYSSKSSGCSRCSGCSGALFDRTGRYRYSLWREWSTDHPRVVFVMLNPGTADEQRNDPTISRCISFAHAWGFGSVEVVNLFAYRTSYPVELFKQPDPIGEENDRFLVQALERAACIVAAWGAKGTLLGRDQYISQLLAHRHDVYCFGTTKGGHPRHPLYIKGDTSLVAFGALSRGCICEGEIV